MLTDRDIQILRFVNEYGGITINQAYKLFWRDAAYGQDMARKRLKHLADTGALKFTELKQSTSNERVYYITRPYSTHALYLLDFYSNLIFYGAEILDFRKEIVYSKMRSDCLIKFGYKGGTYIAFVEVVITNQVNYGNYENLKETGQLQEELGAFPSIIIISNVPQKYQGRKLAVKYIDYRQKDFVRLILP